MSFLGWPLDDNKVLLEEFLELGNTFNMIPSDAAGNKGACGRKFMSDVDMTVINGGRLIRLLAKKKEIL